jgi:polysaccharide biosynthesis PFTS motif protein
MENGKTPDKDLLFIGISFKFFWSLLLSKFFNWNIYILDVSTHHAVITILQKMHKSQWIVRVTEQHHAFYNSHTVAIEFANKIIDRDSNNTVIQLARKLCKSAEVDLIFKRVLAQHLSFLTSINQYVVNNKKIKNPILCVERKYCKVLRKDPEILDTSIIVKYKFYWGKAKLWAIWLMIAFGYILHLIIQFFYKKTTVKKAFKYAISIPFPWAAKFKGAREFTFLVDNKIIKKDETVFLVEYPEKKEFYQRYSDSGYHLIEALNIHKVSDLFKRSTLRFRDDFLNVLNLLIARKRGYFAYEALISLLFYRISWSIIISQTSFENYIYFNKEGKSQNAINIFLKEKKITTHAYSQFIGGPYQICGNDSILDERNIHYSFLNPDYYYLNNQAMADSMTLHCQKTVKHKVIGNIFSEKIIEIKGDADYIEKLRSQYKVKNRKKVVSIFDTSYLELKKHYSTYDEAQYFLKDVIKLAKSMPECMFLFKPSKNDAWFLKGYWSDEKGVEVVRLRHKFEQLENTMMLLDSDDVIDVISVSDVVFTNSFSSPTTDALLANIPAFWYQSKTNVSFSIYNKVPNLVVSGYIGLTTQINNILQDNNPVNFPRNLDFLYLIGDIDEKPLTSLRLNFANA